MGLISKIKSYLPGSSRSLHAMHDDLHDMVQRVSDNQNQFSDQQAKMAAQLREIEDALGDIYRRVEVADRGINGNIDFKFEERTIPMVERLSNDLDAHDTHIKMIAWELFRHDGESVDDAKKRFFRSLPGATGGLRLLQLGCAQLLREFHDLCKANGLNYWLAFGTLLGAVRHQGFIPWDDDVDLGMMRDDVDRLASLVNSEGSRYRVTVVYDYYVKCRQVRFQYSDGNIPCFLDLFIYDWAPANDALILKRSRALRSEMVAQMDADEELRFWEQTPYYHGDDEKGRQIQRYYDDYVQKARETGLICDENDGAAVLWSIDNLDDGKQLRMIFDADVIFPNEMAKFESSEFCVPHDADYVLRSRYGNYLELPKDINTHYQHIGSDRRESLEAENAIKGILK